MIKTNFSKQIVKIINWLLTNLALLILCNSICFASTYYVSTKGTDQNNGTINYPFKSIQFGIEKLSTGDTLYIREGVYYLNKYTYLKSNTNILAYNNEKVEIHATEQKNEWTTISENLWKCKQKDSVIQLFINGLPYFQASYPTISEGLYALKNGVFAIAYPDKKVHIQGIEKFNNLVGARMLGLHGKGLVSLNGKIIEQNGDKIKVENNAFYWDTLSRIRKEYLDTGTAFFVGSKQFMDKEREWYWENQELYLLSNEDPNLLQTEVRINYYLFEFSNCLNIKISGITFKGANINLSNSSNCVITNCQFTYITPFFHFPDGFERFNPLLDTNNKVYFDPPEKWTGKGLTISGSNNTIENCYIAHSWGDGLTVWGTNHKILNNEIYDCDWIANDCAPLTITGNGHLVQYNTIHKSARSILVHRKMENSKIINNHLYDAGLLCEDLGITYCYETDGANTEIAFNYLHDNKASKSGAALYIDNSNKNFNIHHNIITNSLVGITINKSTENNTIFNNTLYNNTYSMGSWGPEGTELKNVHTFNNITDSDKRERWNYKDFYGTKLESNYKYNEPIFQDPINHNFQLKKFSYPIDKGTSNEYTISFEGKAPDLGALESGKIPFTYGASIIVPNEKYYPPRAPIKLKLTANTPDTTLFKWEYPFGECDTFYIERKISTDTFKIIQRLAANQLEFNDSMQPPGEYRYQIRAKNQYGISEPSNSIEIFNPKYNNSFFLDAENNDLQTGTVITGDYISNADEADWIAYKQINFSENKYDACIVNMAVPCEQAWQEVQVRIDRPMGRMIGNFTTTSTGAWDKFEQRTFPIEPITGYHDVYIKFKGEAGIGSFDWFNLYNSNGTLRKTYPQATNNCPQERNTSRQIPITIYPNPSNEEVAVAIENLETSTITIKFASLNGVLWLNKTYTNQLPGTQEYYLHNEINIPQLEKGMYIIEITVAGKRVTLTKNYKFIKN